MPSKGLAVEKLRKELSRLRGVRFISLFGSIAEGKTTPLSDVDVAVLPEEGADELLLVADILEIVTRSLGVTEDRVDVLLLNHANSLPLLYNAVVRGILLYCSDPQFCSEYKRRILSQYLDYLVFREKLDLRRKFLEAVGRSLR